MSAFKKIADYFYNLYGWKSDRKLIVISSDDWGSVRVESNESRNALIAAGFNMDSNRFNKYDAIESNEDMERLFGVLTKHRDCNGNYPVFTAMTNVANPDFDKIERNNFNNYYCESFSETLKRYPHRDKVLDFYREGISTKIFVPQYHGREHVNVLRWMKALQQEGSNSRVMFRNHFYMPDAADIAVGAKGWGAAYDVDRPSDIDYHKEVLLDGLDRFEELFGYRARFFTAPSLLFNSALEPILEDAGIKVIDVPKLRRMPLGNNKFKKSVNYIGKKGHNNILYTVRNAVFEPNIGNTDGVAECLHSITSAFSNGKPAIISNHRAAFSGEISAKNRELGLESLDRLLSTIVKKWPDAEFVTIMDLYDQMKNDKGN